MFKVLYDKPQANDALSAIDNSNLDQVSLQDLMSLWDESNSEEEGWTFQIPGVTPGTSIQSHLCNPQNL